jgi:hypothetical protein
LHATEMIWANGITAFLVMVALAFKATWREGSRDTGSH